MNSIWIITKNTYREIIRDRILYGLIVFALLMFGVSLALGQLSFIEQARISANFGFAAIHLGSVILAIFIGSTLVSKEIEKKTILTILVRPLSRLQFLLGKSLGLMLVIITIISSLALIQGMIFWFMGVPILNTFFISLYGMLIESFLLMGLAMMFSTFSSPTLVVSFSIGVFLIGHWLENLNFLAQKSHSNSFSVIAKIVAFSFPNLERFNWRPLIMYGGDVPFSEIVTVTFYGLGWWLLFFIVSAMIVRRKDFA